MNFVKNFVNDIFEISTNSNQVYCPKNCPFISKGQISSHRFHCLDSSNEQISQTINGLTCLLLTIYNEIENRLQTIQHQNHKDFESVKDKIQKINHELSKVLDSLPVSSKSKSKKTIDNSLILNLQQKVEELRESMDTLTTRLTSKIRILLNSMTSEVTRDFKNAMSKNSLNQNSTLTELSSEIESLVKEFKFDPNNPKPIELKTEENSSEILRLNKRVLPVIKDASIAIERSNVLLEQTFDVLTKVKVKLGIDDEF